MICVTRLNGIKFWINPHQIERMEAAPDVTLHMLSGQCFVVKEPPEQVVALIAAYRRTLGMVQNEN